MSISFVVIAKSKNAMGTSGNIKELFENSFNELSAEEKTEHNAGILAMKFLGLVDAEMEARHISKKELSQKVGTSASFITQLFMGDRKPSWNMLARMQDALGLEFEVTLARPSQQV
ncbi:MAG: XRE family transcriptional regulator [Cryomorphaceae bacterium]|nr:MAG: XRE family transcriptional regulator [Cryomorphaceae bacterium]